MSGVHSAGGGAKATGGGRLTGTHAQHWRGQLFSRAVNLQIIIKEPKNTKQKVYFLLVKTSPHIGMTGRHCMCVCVCVGGGGVKRGIYHIETYI